MSAAGAPRAPLLATEVAPAPLSPCAGRWVFEEYVKLVDGKWERPARGAKPPEGKTWLDEGYQALTAVINEKHENVRAHPGPVL